MLGSSSSTDLYVEVAERIQMTSQIYLFIYFLMSNKVLPTLVQWIVGVG
jgi:hypothetical protein